MKTRTPTSVKGLASKALAVPLSVMLAAGLAPTAAFAGDMASADASALQAAQVVEGSGRVGAAGVSASAKTLSEALYRIYLPVLFRAENGMGEFADSYQSADASSWAPEYCVFDLLNDGVPELLVRTSSVANNGLVQVFTVQSGSLVKLGSYWEWFGGSAGSPSGRLFAAGWNAGSSYVNELVVERNQVVSRFRVSGKATNANPSGEVEALSDYLDEVGAKWLSFTRANDLSTLNANAKYSLSKGSLKVASGGTYTGAAKTPAVTVQFNGDTLEQGTDYDVMYKNNVKAGTATATVTGKGDYEGSLSTPFVISRARLASGTVSVASGGTYTGAAKTPSVTVRFNGNVLERGADYDVTYKNNVKAGTARATVTGKGDYEGSLSTTFVISRASIASGTVSVASGGTYTGAAKTPSVTVRFNGKALERGADYVVTYKNNVNAGTATATVTGKGDYEGSLSTPFVISRASIESSTVSVASGGTYTGAAKAPAVSARLGNKALRQGSDYQVTYRDNTNAGAATATIVGKGNYTGSKAAGFSIAKAANTMALKSSSKTLKRKKLAKSSQTFKAVSLSRQAQGRVSFSNASSKSVSKKFSVNKSTGAITAKKGTKKGKYSVKVQANATGDGNFNGLSQIATVKVTVK